VPASETQRRENLVGTFVLALSDRFREETEAAIGHSGAGTAAMTMIAQFPDLPIEALRHRLGLSHPATVPAVDRLVEQGFLRGEPSGSGPAVSLVPTATGRAKAGEILEVGQRTIRGELPEVSDDEAEALTSVLERSLNCMSNAPGTTVCRLCDAGRCRRKDCPVVHRRNELGNPPPDPTPLAPPRWRHSS